MRERVFTIILAAVVIVAAVAVAVQLGSVLPVSILGGSGLAFYTLGRQNGYASGLRTGSELGWKHGYAAGLADTTRPADPRDPDTSAQPVSPRR